MSELAYLKHHGTTGMRHGQRRFQNYDGSLTPAGRERYGVGPARTTKHSSNADSTGSKFKSSKLYSKASGVYKDVKKDVKREFSNSIKNETTKAIKNAGAQTLKSAGAIFVANKGPVMLSNFSSAVVSAGSALVESAITSGFLPMAAIGIGITSGGYATYKYVKNRKRSYLAHHGIKGQEHGHRRFQNYDGSLTPAGRERYGVGPARKVSQTVGKIKKSISDMKEANLERKRNRNEQLRIKTDRIKESAYLKEEEKRLRKEMKRAKREGTKEARGDYSRKDIKSLTDEEIQARLNRLQQESKLIDAQLNQNPMYKAVRDALVRGGSQAIQNVAQNTLTDLGKKYLKVDLNTAANKTTKDIENELRDKFNLRKLQDEIAGYEQSKQDEELRNKVTRAQNMQNLVDSKKKIYGPMYKSEDDKNKIQQRRKNEREELERRAKAYYKGGDRTLEQVARAMNLPLSTVKDLLYVIDDYED